MLYGLCPRMCEVAYPGICCAAFSVLLGKKTYAQLTCTVLRHAPHPTPPITPTPPHVPGSNKVGRRLVDSKASTTTAAMSPVWMVGPLG